MVIVFLPALDGLRPQWREACESLGGSAWTYWRYVAFPITLAVLSRRHAAPVRQRLLGLRHGGADLPGKDPLVSLRIGTFLTSEIVLGQANVGKALAFGMIMVIGGDHDGLR